MLSLLVLALCLQAVVFGAPDNQGTEFILGFTEGLHKPAYTITVTTSQRHDVAVRVTSPRFEDANLNETFVVKQGVVQNITISNLLRATGGREKKAVHVTADEEITVYVKSTRYYSNTALGAYFLAYPTDVLGKEYYLVTCYGSGSRCYHLIVGHEDSTNVTLEYLKNDGTNQVLFGTTREESIFLDRFNTYLISGYGPIYLRIKSDKKVAVFTYSSARPLFRLYNYATDGGPTLEQTLPVETWGRRFIINKIISDWRLTHVYIGFFSMDQGALQRTYTAKDGSSSYSSENTKGWTYTIWPDYNFPMTLESTEPGIVVLFFHYVYFRNQYITPYLTLPPVELYPSAHDFVVLYRDDEYSADPAALNNTFALIVKERDYSGLRLDGNAMPNETSCSGLTFQGDKYLACQTPITVGTHSVQHESPNVVFGSWIEGISISEIYVIPTGTRLAHINMQCTNSPGSSGDGIDNDCDEMIDEELCNSEDDDGDGLIDEDCAGACPCLNGGKCIGGENNTACNCTTGYRGTFCELDSCTANYCKNGGLCAESETDISCRCQNGYNGSYCEIAPYSPGRSVVKPGHIYVNGEHTVILRCKFSTVQGYMYTISWFSDESIVKVSPSLNSSEAQTHFITDDEFAENSNDLFIVNRKIYCLTDVFEINDDAGKSLERSTPEIFTPLEIDLTPISMNKGEDKIIPVKINIPFGCSPSSVNCSLQVQLYDPTEVFARNQMTIGFKNTGVCGVEIDKDKFLQNGENSSINRNIVVTSVNDMQFEREKTVNLKVKTRAIGDTKSYWTRTSSDSVPVSISELQWRRRTYCYSHVDPHMQTFDGRRYENQHLDVFVMYLNKDWQITIQSKTKRCNGNRATCSCSCTMQSGGDIFMINHCDTHRTQFLSDNNKALYVYRITTNKYEIKFPNLLRVIVQILPHYEYTMNIDVYPAPADRNRVEGLCGNFNGDPNDDFVPRGSTKSTTTNNFAMSWGLINTNRENESLQSTEVVKNTTRWNEGGTYCVCLNDKTGGDMEAVCKENKQDLFIDEIPGDYLPITAKPWVNPVEIQAHKEVKKRDAPADTGDTLDLDVARTLCENALQGCPMFLKQDEFAEISVESFVEECAMDVAMTGDVDWAVPHCDALSNKVVTQLEIDEDFKDGLNKTVVYEVLSQTCPGNCSGHGTCLNGSCVCEDGYGTDECLVNFNIPPVLGDISPDGFCDIARGEDCYDITISGDGFIDNPTCRIQIEQADVTGYYGSAVTMDTECSYLEFNELSVNVTATDLRQNISDNGMVVAERYGFSVSNNNVNFSEFRYVSVIDSRCQNTTTDENGTLYVELKPSFCIINRVCHSAGRKFNECSMCEPSVSPFTWTNACNDTEDAVDSDDQPNMFVIAVSATAGVIVLALLCVVVWVIHRARKAKRRSPRTRSDHRVPERQLRADRSSFNQQPARQYRSGY